MRLKGNAGREIPCGMLTRVPISVNVQIFIDRLLETELPACAVCGRDDIFCKVIAARGESSTALKRFTYPRIRIIAYVVRLVPDRNKYVVDDDD